MAQIRFIAICCGGMVRNRIHWNKSFLLTVRQICSKNLCRWLSTCFLMQFVSLFFKIRVINKLDASDARIFLKVQQKQQKWPSGLTYTSWLKKINVLLGYIIFLFTVNYDCKQRSAIKDPKRTTRAPLLLSSVIWDWEVCMCVCVIGEGGGIRRVWGGSLQYERVDCTGGADVSGAV